MNEWLYKRTSSGKIQSWKVVPAMASFIVNFGQLNGKIQRVITLVEKGKQKRNKQQQVEFEIKALYKGKRDEGYKSLIDLNIDESRIGKLFHNSGEVVTLEDMLITHLPKHNTNSGGHLKVMLSQPISRTIKGIETNYWDKIELPCALEPKLDGVRCTIKKRKADAMYSPDDLFDIPIDSFSRESMDYNFGTRKIREKLVSIFDVYPDLVLDGELYKHDIPQNHISGAMRSKGGGEHRYVFDIMEYHVYDIIDTDLTFKQRREFLEQLIEDFPTAFVLNPIHEVHNKEEIDILEEHYVNLDYEGIMLKKFKGMYRPNVRSYDSIKVKRFYDGEFEVTGYSFGARGVQDLIITCLAENGEEFKATAVGTILEKENLRHEIDKTLSSKLMGTIKYKFISENGIPSHANFKGLR